MAGDRRPREWAGAGEEGDRGSPGRDSLESSPHPEAFVRIRPRGPRGVARPRRLPARVPFRRERGTLGVVTEVTLRVLPVPARRVTMLLYLDRFEDLGPAVADILTWGPSAIEAVDGGSLAPLDREALGISRTAQATLLAVVYYGDSAAISGPPVRSVAALYWFAR